VLGALSPGPLLVLVVCKTMLCGHKLGLATAISQGFGTGLYVAIGIRLVIVESLLMFQII